ncbi:MAG: response regulator [Pacificimonas sp.]
MSEIQDPLGVFIIEDEALIAMDIQAMIEDAGHRVIGEAASFNTVCGHANLKDADLFLVDIQLSGAETGIDAADYLREHSKAIIIFTTANPEYLPDDIGSGDGVITKPLQAGVFKRTLTYLHECERRPPPASALPEEVRIAKSLSARWQD